MGTFLQWNYAIIIPSLMKLSPSSEATNFAATQELPSVLWKPKVHYCVDKRPPLVPIMSQIFSVHTIPSYLSKNHFNIVHPLMPWSSQWFFHSGFPTNILYALIFSFIHAACSIYLILLDLIVLINLEKNPSYEAPHYAS